MDLILLLKAAVLGLVEGLTEFIPVSSTGHLILVGDWLNFSGPSAKTFEIFIQLGAILSVVWIYRDRVFRVPLEAPHDPASRRLLLNLLIAFLPAAIVGLAAHDAIKRILFGPLPVAVAMLAGGLVILVIERWAPATRVTEVEGITPRLALGVGLAQVLSLFPGISRSGSTILGGYVLGLSRRAATEFSFFLAIPVMLAATVFDLLKSRADLHSADIPIFAVGFLVAFASALVIVRGFLGWVGRHSFVPFAWYRLVVGTLLLVYYWPRS
jgi:undecaprenyl-diphosphatase